MAKHSPLPWRLAPGDNPPDFSRTVDGRGCFVFGDNSGPKKADAALIVEAVNGRQSDEALIASLLYHHLEDFAEAVASDNFTKVVKAAFKRLGLKYEPFGPDAFETVEQRMKGGRSNGQEQA